MQKGPPRVIPDLIRDPDLDLEIRLNYIKFQPKCYNSLVIKTILFDIGGVVTETDFGAVYSGFGSQVGLTKDIIENYHKKNFNELLLGNISLGDFWRDIKSLGGNNDIDYETIWVEEISKNRLINTGLLDIIQKLRKNYTVGVLSNLTFSRLVADDKINLYSNFDYAVLSCVEHLRKPDPSFYHLALKKASVNPEETVFIDDKNEHTDAAKKIGIQTILYTYGNNEKLIDDLRKLGISIF